MTENEYIPDPCVRGHVKKNVSGDMVLYETFYNGTVAMDTVETLWKELNEKQKQACVKYYGVDREKIERC